MWLEHRWQVAAFSEELGNAGAGSLLPRKIGGRPILMYRTEAGQPVALTDACAHRKLPLSLGKRVGDNIQCAYHGMTYRPDGSCVAIPGQTSIPAGARVAPYPIVERAGLLWVWTAEPALADPASIPDLPWLHDGKWTVVRGYHYIEAGPLLVVDNLLDLSHETFVHAETIGNAAVADSPVTAEIIDGKRVRVHRYMSRITPPALYAEQRGEPLLIDRWHTTFYDPPGVVVIESGSKPSDNEVTADVQERRIINLITPETGTTSHYFWCIARNYQLLDDAVSQKLRQDVIFTFDQDKALLEAQQRAVGNETNPTFPLAIMVDAGPIQGRRLLRTLVEAEQSASRPSA